jgi:nicotinate-nucleotide adenylyltransferase
MRIGILGGTFDPIHVEHLSMAERARHSLSLEEVVFIPAGRPWMKEREPISSAEYRLEMVQLAVEGKPFFRASDMEIRRQGPTYTVETVEAMLSEKGKGAEIYLILGIDALGGIPHWKDPRRLLEICVPVVFGRAGYSIKVIRELEEKMPGLRESIIVVEGPTTGISSSDIRNRVASGSSIKRLVPREVETFIFKRRMYT